MTSERFAMLTLTQHRRISFDTWKTVTSIQSQLQRQLSPWTQAPVTFDDALGRVVPIPLELVDSWEVCFPFK